MFKKEEKEKQDGIENGTLSKIFVFFQHSSRMKAGLFDFTYIYRR